MLVFDCTGDKARWKNAIQLLQQGGKLIFVGLINDTISAVRSRPAPPGGDDPGEPQQHRRRAPSRAGMHGERADRCRGVAHRLRPPRSDGQAVPPVASSRGRRRESRHRLDLNGVARTLVAIINLTHQATCFKMGSWQPNQRHFKTQSSTSRTLKIAANT